MRAILIIALLLAQSAATAGEFTQTLTPEKLRAAGLGKLTQEELLQLDVLVEQYKAGALQKAVAAAPAPDKPATPAAPPEPRASKLMPEWVGALLTLERVGKRSNKSEALESRIAGNFDGWSGRSSFKLENGQLWTQVNNESYVYAPVMKSPKVKIFPATFGTFWLEVEGVNQRCRVKPVRLE